MTTRTETPLMAWHRATADLRRTLTAEAYERHLDEIQAERMKRKLKNTDITETQRRKARNIAKGEVIRKLATMTEHEGVRNPLADDPEWGPSAGPQTPETDPELDDLAAWLAEQTWSEFAVSLAQQYRSKGSLSPKQVTAAKSMRAKVEAKNAERKKRRAVDHTKATGLDLSDLPSGYYAVPGGETRLKVRVSRGRDGTRWEGWTFVSDGAEYGKRKNYGKQAPSGRYQGDIADALEAILADPFEAQKAYGRLTGTCGSCGRKLEDETSVSLGIGPWCRNKWAA